MTETATPSYPALDAARVQAAQLAARVLAQPTLLGARQPILPGSLAYLAEWLMGLHPALVDEAEEPEAASSLEAKIETREGAYRHLMESARAYRRERNADREHLDRLTAAAETYLASTTSEDGARLQQLHEALRAAQKHLAEPRHDEDWDVEP